NGATGNAPSVDDRFRQREAGAAPPRADARPARARPSQDEHRLRAVTGGARADRCRAARGLPAPALPYHRAMPISLDGQLVVAISSRALFDFEEENQVFEASDDRAYMRLQLERVDNPAKPGVAFSLVK